MGRHLHDPTAVTQVALTSGSARTPHTTRPTMVTVVADWNPVASGATRTLTIQVAAVIFQPVAVSNGDGVSARRRGLSITFLVPPNVGYNATASDVTNLTLQANEVYL